MKILHIITSLRLGGAERLVTDLLPRLRDRGHRVELLLFDGTRTPLYEQLEQQNIPIHALGRGTAQMHNPVHLFRLKKYLDRRRFDLVHTHNTPCQLLTALSAGKNAPILVTTEHNTFNRRRNWPGYARIDRWMYGRYDQIACVGEQARCNLQNRLGPDSAEFDLPVIPNGIDLARFVGAASDCTRRAAADAAKRVVLMVAAFRPQKDQPTLIRALQHLPDDYCVWLAGDGPIRPACEGLAAALNLSERVRFWGNRTDVPQLLAAADAVVLSSHYEGLSLSSIEGMAAGKPVIASDVAGLRDTVGGAGLLFPPGDHEALARCIRQVCEDRTFGLAVAARCCERAMQYDISRTVAGYDQLYRNLVQQKQ